MTIDNRHWKILLFCLNKKLWYVNVPESSLSTGFFMLEGIWTDVNIQQSTPHVYKCKIALKIFKKNIAT